MNTKTKIYPLMLLLIAIIEGDCACTWAASSSCVTTPSDTVTVHAVDVNTAVPKHLEGATIIVRTKDGRESQVPAEKFKVVPRKQQFKVTKVEHDKVTTCDILDGEKREPHKNRVSILGGYGTQEGLDVQRGSTSTSVQSKTGVVGGLQYQRSLTERFSIGVQGQTNKTGSLILGVDF